MTHRLRDLAGRIRETCEAVETGAREISRSRERFMATVMNQEDDKCIAYWTVRRHVGKGTPPREVKSAAEMIDAVHSTPGAIGYIAVSDLRPGMNVVLRPCRCVTRIGVPG